MANYPPYMTPASAYGKKRSLLFPFIIVSLLFLATLGFAFWAYAGMQDNKVNLNKKIATAVAVAKQETATEKDKEFSERDKSPLKNFKGSDVYGGVSFNYPRTYSALIEDSSDETPLKAYFKPDFLPGIADNKIYALRIELLKSDYANTLNELVTTAGDSAVVSAFRATKVPSVLGVKIKGKINETKNGITVLLPIRDKTLKIWTESLDYSNDFDNYILPSLSFTP